MKIQATIQDHDTPVELRIDGEVVETIMPGNNTFAAFEAPESSSIQFDALSIVWGRVEGDVIPLAQPDKIRTEDVTLTVL